MLKRMLFPGFLLSCCFVLSGCATTPTAQEPQEATPTVEAPVATEPAVAEETAVAEEKITDPCDVILNEALMESRKTMKTAERSCQGNRIEATPVWSLDYKGAVHIRIFDGQNQLIRDEIINP